MVQIALRTEGLSQMTGCLSSIAAGVSIKNSGRNHRKQIKDYQDNAEHSCAGGRRYDNNFPSENVSVEEVQRSRGCLNVGRAEQLPEELMSAAVTSLSGSSPAYVHPP